MGDVKASRVGLDPEFTEYIYRGCASAHILAMSYSRWFFEGAVGIHVPPCPHPMASTDWFARLGVEITRQVLGVTVMVGKFLPDTLLIPDYKGAQLFYGFLLIPRCMSMSQEVQKDILSDPDHRIGKGSTPSTATKHKSRVG